jgi:hypothetical protein
VSSNGQKTGLGLASDTETTMILARERRRRQYEEHHDDRPYRACTSDRRHHVNPSLNVTGSPQEVPQRASDQVEPSGNIVDPPGGRRRPPPSVQ